MGGLSFSLLVRGMFFSFLFSTLSDESAMGFSKKEMERLRPSWKESGASTEKIRQKTVIP